MVTGSGCFGLITIPMPYVAFVYALMFHIPFVGDCGLSSSLRPGSFIFTNVIRTYDASEKIPTGKDHALKPPLHDLRPP